MYLEMCVLFEERVLFSERLRVDLFEKHRYEQLYTDTK